MFQIFYNYHVLIWAAVPAASRLPFMWEKELFLKPVLFEFLLHIDWDKLNILTLAGAYNTSKCLVMGIIWSTETLYGLLTLEGKSTSVRPLSGKDCRHQTRFPRTEKYKEVPFWLGHGSRQHWKTAQRVLHNCLQEVLGGNLSGIKRERKKEKRKGFGFVQICKAKRAPDLAIGQCKWIRHYD